MKNKWLLILTAVLLLSFCFTFFGCNEATGDLNIGGKVIQKSVITAQNQKTNVTENVTTDNLTITLKNPTFEEMKDFILKDTTSKKPFVTDKFECRHFATEVDNNAQAAGWRCGFALICYARGQHAVVAFETVDRGLIYIEPQTDVAVDVIVGGTYQNQQIVEILIAW